MLLQCYLFFTETVVVQSSQCFDFIYEHFLYSERLILACQISMFMSILMHNRFSAFPPEGHKLARESAD